MNGTSARASLRYLAFLASRALQITSITILVYPIAEGNPTSLGIEANAEQCTQWLERSPALVTALAPEIGYLGWIQAQEGKLADALTLDANYIRRSDAELHWKGSAGS